MEVQFSSLGGFCFIELRYDLPASYKFHKKKSVSLLILVYPHSVLKNFTIIISNVIKLLE